MCSAPRSDLISSRCAVPDALLIDAGVIRAAFDVKEGDETAFVLSYGVATDAPPPKIDTAKALAATENYWLSWIGKFEAETICPAAVRRSLIVLKGLIYAPTGGIVAAPTTSLPEQPGGDLNWDYRYSWIRDATFTLCALLNSGYQKEAQAWLAWRHYRC